MIIDISIKLPCNAKDAYREVKTLRLLNQVTYPIIKFTPLDIFSPEQALQERPYLMNTKLFGIFPTGIHTMVFSYQSTENFLVMRDNGYSRLCKKWDHKMTFEAQSDGTLYSDYADIRAGLFTPLVWLFAQAFYRYRQRRWYKLSKLGFEYP